MTRPLSDKELLDFIGAIYDCILDPKLWEPTLLKLSANLGFVNAIISAVDVDTGAALINVAAGVRPEHMATLQRHARGDFHKRGGRKRMVALPDRESVIPSRATDRTTRDKANLDTEWKMPQGILDTVAIGLDRDGLLASVVFGRHVDAGPVEDHQLETLRVLAPHFARALEVMRLIGRTEAETSTASSLIDRTRSPGFLLDADANLVFANAAAKAMMAAGDVEQTAEGGIRIPMEIKSKTTLDRAIQSALNQTLAISGVVGIPARRRDGSPMIAYVIPVRPVRLRQGMAPIVAVAVFISNPESASETPSEAAALLYDLTPAEIRVMELVAEGLSMPSVAKALGIRVTTAKTHLQHVFEKTGSHRQADLVGLAASLRPPA